MGAAAVLAHPAPAGTGDCGSGGGLHVLNTAAILGTGGVLAYHAWRRDGRQRSAPAPVTEPAASRSGQA